MKVRKGRNDKKTYILDVIEIDDDEHTSVLLLEPRKPRVVIINIGRREGKAIDLAARKTKFDRPMTHDLAAALISALGGAVKEVRIPRMDHSTFIGSVIIDKDGEEQEVDARPSDSLALAVRVGCPVFVGESVLESAGTDLPFEAKQFAEIPDDANCLIGTLRVRLILFLFPGLQVPVEKVCKISSST